MVWKPTYDVINDVIDCAFSIKNIYCKNGRIDVVLLKCKQSFIR